MTNVVAVDDRPCFCGNLAKLMASNGGALDMYESASQGDPARSFEYLSKPRISFHMDCTRSATLFSDSQATDVEICTSPAKARHDARKH